MNDGVDHFHGGLPPEQCRQLKSDVTQALEPWEITQYKSKRLGNTHGIACWEKRYYVIVFADVILNISIKARLNAHNSSRCCFVGTERDGVTYSRPPLTLNVKLFQQ